MGWSISFLGFNRPPPIEKLKAIPWLESWRLFQEPQTAAWFLEGNDAGEAITFSSEIKTAGLALNDHQTALFAKIASELDRHGAKRYCFEDYATKIAMLLSAELGQAVAAFAGDDEVTDCAFIFDHGKLLRGRLDFEWNKALSFDTYGNAELIWLYPEGVSDEDVGFKPTRYLYQTVLEEAKLFFDSAFLNDTLNFDRSDLDKFLLEAQHGVAHAPYRSKSDLLRDELGSSPSPEKLIAAFDATINAILDAKFPHAENEHRFAMDAAISGYVVYASQLRFSTSPHLKFYADLTEVLSAIGEYSKRLRPKPEFRKKSINFGDWNRELKSKWSQQKRRAGGKKFWLF